MVHPLVDEAKNKDVVSTTPPRSPRTTRSSRIQPQPASSRQEVSTDGATQYTPDEKCSDKWKELTGAYF